MNSQIRAADTDRERVVELLRHQVGTGRLTLEEFSDRAAAAYRARTMGELSSLTRDLPDDADEATGRSGTTRHPASRPDLIATAVVLGLALLAWMVLALYGLNDQEPMGPMGPMMDRMGRPD